MPEPRLDSFTYHGSVILQSHVGCSRWPWKGYDFLVWVCPPSPANRILQTVGISGSIPDKNVMEHRDTRQAETRLAAMDTEWNEHQIGKRTQGAVVPPRGRVNVWETGVAGYRSKGMPVWNGKQVKDMAAIKP